MVNDSSALTRTYCHKADENPLKVMKVVKMKMELSPKQREELLAALKARFEKNMNRHKGLDFRASLRV